MPWETASIPFKGGLDLSENLQVLTEQPNKAIKLQNFEPAMNGGYRRINGYKQHGSGSIPGTGPIQGVMVYKGVVAAREGKLYHTTDGNVWTAIAGVSLSSTNEVEGILYTKDGATELLVVTDGLNKPYYIAYDGATFTVNQPSEDVAGAKLPVIIGERLAFAVDTKLITSNRFDIDKFDKGFEANLLMTITAIKAFRERLIIFSRYRIKQAVSIDDHTKTTIKDVTAKIGCVDGATVQEIGGDLLFLAPDGLRTVAATARIDDIELSVMSHAIKPLTQDLMTRLKDYKFSSTVMRESSQYRLYAFDKKQRDASDLQFGIIASLAYLEEGPVWQFAQTRGIPAYTLGDGLLDDEEVSYFGTRTGKVYAHNVGDDFDGSDIRALFYTPYFSLGNLSLRKTVHTIQPFIVSEDRTDNIMLLLRYNYNDQYTHQPAPYIMDPFVRPSLYSRTEYAHGVYGATPEGARKVNVEGSGHTVQLRFVSEGGSPFVVQGFNIDFSFGGKI